MLTHRIVMVVVTAATLARASPALAEPKDYRFELQGPPVKAANATSFKVRLVHIPDGKPAAGAIIIQTRFDMSPASMPEMTAPAKITASTEPGVYDVEARPSAAGEWGLTLAAKVQGEAQTVKGTVTITVPK
jgi:hypothetical protein